MVRFVAIVVAAALAAIPAAALGASAGGSQQQTPLGQQQQHSPLQDTAPQQGPAPVQQQQQLPASQTEANSGSLSGRDVLLIGIAIVALIGGIWFVIARDAKRVTAGRLRTSDGAVGEGRGGSATRAARRNRRLSAEERKRRKRGRAQ